MGKLANWNAQTIAQKWATAMGSAAAQNNYKTSTAAVTTSPMQLAATDQAMADYVTGCTNSVANGRRLKGLNKRTLQYWQQMCATKGASRLGTGATAAQPQYQAAIQALIPVWNAMQAAADSVTGPKSLATASAKANAALAILMQMAGTA